MTKKIDYKITIFGACAPYPRLIYWIASSISQGKKDDMSSISGLWSWEYQERGQVILIEAYENPNEIASKGKSGYRFEIGFCARCGQYLDSPGDG